MNIGLLKFKENDADMLMKFVQCNARDDLILNGTIDIRPEHWIERAKHLGCKDYTIHTNDQASIDNGALRVN